MLETNDASDAIDEMSALHDEIERRLLATSADYRALVALKKAMHEVRSAGIAESTHKFRRRLKQESERGISHADAAAAVLEDQGEPVPLVNLLELVRSKGAVVGGTDPSINLSSTLSKDDRFESIRFNGRRCWWLAGHRLPKNESAG
jgi:hypothetical protein